MSGNTRGWSGGDGLDSLPRGGEKKITALSKVPKKGVGELNFGKISNRCMYHDAVNILLIFCCNNLTEGAHSL